MKNQKKLKNKFDFTGENQFSGIFEYLISISRIDDEVDFTASHGHPNIVVKKKKNNYFKSQNALNSWICFNFKQHSVIPKAYSIRTIKGHPETFYPKSFWSIKKSNDKYASKIIDKKNDCSDLKCKQCCTRVHD